jgi:hypothetical protein
MKNPYRLSEARDLMRKFLAQYLEAFARNTGLSIDDTRDLARLELDELARR